MKIPLCDLKAQYASIQKEIDDAIKSIIARTNFIQGEEVRLLEKEFAAFCGARFGVACASGTDALHLTLLALGVGPDDEVITSPHTFTATAEAVYYCGARPVFVDIDPRTFNLDPSRLEEKITPRTKVIMPVHLYGQPADMDPILEIAGRHGLPVLEDACQAHGAEYKGRRVGSIGAAACFSFYPAKNLGAFGQGGAVLTNDEALAAAVRMYVEQGQGSRRYYHDVIGYNGRLHSLQACVLGKLLPKLDSFNAARLRAADWYAACLPADRLQRRTPGSVPVYHLFEYRCDDPAQRDRLAAAFQAAGVPFAYHYPVPIHKQKAYPRHNALSLPVAERLADTLISLPMHPGLTEEQVERVCQVIRKL